MATEVTIDHPDYDLIRLTYSVALFWEEPDMSVGDAGGFGVIDTPKLLGGFVGEMPVTPEQLAVISGIGQGHLGLDYCAKEAKAAALLEAQKYGRDIDGL